jgi:hypothetical protein
MVKTALVSTDIERGSELLEVLDRAGLKMAVALWAVLSEYEDWRLVVSSRQLDSRGIRDGYGLIFDALRAAGFTPEKTPTITLRRMTDPLIKDLRRRYRKFKDVEGMRPGGQMIGDTFVEDAYVYRIS